MVSYTAFYKLAEEPFSLTPDPRFLFESKQHHYALKAVLYGLETHKGIIAIIGDVGTGKTTLCRTLLKVLPSQYKTALLLDPHVSEEDLVRVIIEDLGVRPNGAETSSVMRALEAFLLQIGERGECAVILLDEAQLLSQSVLERLRILSNFETSTRKLLQIILVGQSELEEKLQHYNLRQLNQRIGVRCYLRPLSRRETSSYVEHRLRRAGLTGPLPFTRPALQRIRRFSQGTPRLINLLCDRALLIGFRAGAHRIGSSLVATAVKELQERRPKQLLPRLAAAALGGLALAVLVGVAAWQTMGWNLSSALTVAKLQSLSPSPPSADRETPPTQVAAPATPPQAKAVPPAPQRPQGPATQQQTASIPKSVKIPAEGIKRQLPRLLALWGVKMPGEQEIASWTTTPDGSLDVRVIASRHGLEATFLEPISWRDIYAVGLPVLVKIGKEEGFSLLLRLEGEKAVILSPAGTEYERPTETLAAQQLRSAWFLWRNPDEWALRPVQEWSARLVTLFAARLNVMGYVSYPFPVTYDDRFSEAVRRFQQKVGLETDGIIGPRTAMALARVTGYPTVPRIHGERLP